MTTALQPILGRIHQSTTAIHLLLSKCHMDPWGRINPAHPESAEIYLDVLLGRTDMSGDRVTERPR